MDKIFDPKCEHFDADECWDADCKYVNEVTYGDPEDEYFEIVLCCCAPANFVCSLFQKFKKDVNYSHPKGCDLHGSTSLIAL